MAARLRPAHREVESSSIPDLPASAGDWVAASNDDPVVLALWQTAVQTVQERTRRAVELMTVRWYFNLPPAAPGISDPWGSTLAGPPVPALPSPVDLELPLPPVTGVTEVKVATGPGEDDLTTVDPTLYRVAPSSRATPARVVGAEGAAWPSPYRGQGGVQVTASHGDSVLAADLQSAALLLTGYLYDNRGCGAEAAWQKSGAATVASRVLRVGGGTP